MKGMIKPTNAGVAAFAVLAASASLSAQTKTITLKDAQGQSVGTAELSYASEGAQMGVQIKVNLMNLPPRRPWHPSACHSQMRSARF